MSIAGQPKWVNEAVDYFKHEKAPAVANIKTIQGTYQVRVEGIRRKHVQVRINIVDPHLNVLKTWKPIALRIGNAVMVKNCKSTFEIMGKITEAYLQIWVTGVSVEDTEAEISVRLVDAERRQLAMIGSKTMQPGDHTEIKGLDVKLRIEKQ